MKKISNLDSIERIKEQAQKELEEEIERDKKKKRKLTKKEIDRISKMNKKETNYNVLRRILYLYSKKHPEVSYVQGMNEICAII